jgi:hypothetical protein
MDEHNKCLDNQKAKMMFEGLSQITKQGYVGKVDGMESISQRLMRLKQSIFNARTRKR